MTDVWITLRLMLISLPTWVAFGLLDVACILLGWVVVPIAVWRKAYYNRPSKYYNKEVTAFTWPWMWVWGNEEDGIYAGVQYRDMKSVPKQIIYWSCLRNPANNLRFIKWLSCRIEYSKVRFTGSFGDALTRDDVIALVNAGRGSDTSIIMYDTKVPQWFICWHGLHSCWYWQFHLLGQLRRLWVGWKIYPTDVYGVTEYRRYGAGFSIQLKRVS